MKTISEGGDAAQTPAAASAQPVASPPAAPAPLVQQPVASPPAGARRLLPSVVQRGLRISVVEGALATVTLAITGAIGGSVFLTGFALLLGANSFQLGLLGALPFIGQLFQFVGAYLEERIGRRRPLVLVSALAGRMLWLPLLALPFVAGLGSARLGIFLVALAASYALNGIAGNAWLSWMSDLVPPRQRGRYFGMRNTILGVATMVTTYAAGQILDYYRASGREAVGFAVIFSLAVVFALGSAVSIALQPEPPLQRKARVRVGELFSAPLRNQRFRGFVLVATVWLFILGIASPFFYAFGINTLQLSFSTLGLTAVVTAAVSLVTQPYIGRLQDRLGDKTVIVWSCLGASLMPWGWILSTPANIVPLWLTAIFSGVFWPGLNQGMVNLLMGRAPAEGRAAFLASYGAITGLGTLVAGLLGGALAASLAGLQLPLGPVVITNLSLLFVLTSLGRLAMVFVFWRSL